MGVNYYFQKVSGQERKPLASLVNAADARCRRELLVGQAKELLAFLSLSDNAANARVISEPSLIATDSIPASINVGTQVPVLTGTVITPGGGTNTQTQGISSHNTGVTLQVNARVNPSGVVTLIINQEVSKPTTTTTSSIPTPSFDQQVVQTQITMQDGDTIAIGGLISENTSSGSAGIPGLNRLPYVGGLFGSKTYSHDRSELIIFMTPHVIYDTNDLLEASQELKAPRQETAQVRQGVADSASGASRRRLHSRPLFLHSVQPSRFSLLKFVSEACRVLSIETVPKAGSRLRAEGASITFCLT